jgi:hypothetical protein
MPSNPNFSPYLSANEVALGAGLASTSNTTTVKSDSEYADFASAITKQLPDISSSSTTDLSSMVTSLKAVNSFRGMAAPTATADDLEDDPTVISIAGSTADPSLYSLSLTKGERDPRSGASAGTSRQVPFKLPSGLALSGAGVSDVTNGKYTSLSKVALTKLNYDYANAPDESGYKTVSYDPTANDLFPGSKKTVTLNMAPSTAVATSNKPEKK